MAEVKSRPRAAVFIDTENLFFAFQLQEKKNQWSDGKLAQITKTARALNVPEDDLPSLGPSLFLHLGSWLARRYRVRPARSYGMPTAPGVRAVRKLLQSRTKWAGIDIVWTHTGVWDTPDAADEVLKEDLRLYAKDEETDVLVVGSNDMKRQGGILTALLPLVSGRQKIVVVRPPGVNLKRFSGQGDLADLRTSGEVVSLTAIYGQVQERIFADKCAAGGASNSNVAYETMPQDTSQHVAAAKSRSARKKLTAKEKDQRDDALLAAWFANSEDNVREAVAAQFAGVTQAPQVGARSSRLLARAKVTLPGGPRREFIYDLIAHAAEERRLLLEGMGR